MHGTKPFVFFFGWIYWKVIFFANFWRLRISHRAFHRLVLISFAAKNRFLFLFLFVSEFSFDSFWHKTSPRMFRMVRWERRLWRRNTLKSKWNFPRRKFREKKSKTNWLKHKTKTAWIAVFQKKKREKKTKNKKKTTQTTFQVRSLKKESYQRACVCFGVHTHVWYVCDTNVNSMKNCNRYRCSEWRENRKSIGCRECLIAHIETGPFVSEVTNLSLFCHFASANLPTNNWRRWQSQQMALCTPAATSLFGI